MNQSSPRDATKAVHAMRVDQTPCKRALWATSSLKGSPLFSPARAGVGRRARHRASGLLTAAVTRP